jgi:hypothetical protein
MQAIAAVIHVSYYTHELGQMWAIYPRRTTMHGAAKPVAV